MIGSMAVLALTALAAPADVPVPAGYQLVWNDEFDKDGAPDPARWGYEVGYVRNNEAQYYTKERSENCRIEGGRLVIEGRREKYAIPGAKDGKQADYTAASINTLGKASWTYGRIEVRAKLPRGKGVWPAIWMLGDNIEKIGWPACGEIDIMEFVGHTADKTYATVHWRLDGQHKSSGGNLTVKEPWADFHTYRVDWTTDGMDFYFDDQKVHSYKVSAADEKGENAFRHPQYLLLNLALGGSWGGAIDDSIFPQRFEVDYVRVYQRP
ncbi:MAG: glycoside hydrolase family 16 protein [Armatimonadetes bacterium]|nr:glycoside hydrolase family 16 protein [Armatimonadota bacterium]